MSLIRALLTLSSVCVLIGCVGVVTAKLEYTEVKTDLRAKEQVIAKFGQPLRTVREGDIDAWYYLLGHGPSGNRPADDNGGIAFFVIIPLWWQSKVDENVKFIFRDDSLVGVYELVDKGGGFVCSLMNAHPVQAGCH